MSHELRSPLNSLLILAKSLADNEEKNLTEEQLEAARIIYSSGRDQLNLINDILDLSKVEAGRLEIHRENLYLSSLRNDLDDRFSHLAKEKGLELSILFDSNLPETLNTDAQRIKQIIDNLLSNAIKFTNKGSVTLEVKTTTPNTRFRHPELQRAAKVISFTVVDTGIGISAEKQEAIFEAFRQEDGSTSRSYGGTGLGLTISRQLANLLGGEIHLNSHPGKGCTFTLFMPVRDEKDEALINESSSAATQKGATENARSLLSASSNSASATATSDDNFINDDRQSIEDGDKSLLIIEDDPIFAQIILQMARENGYKVLAACNGRSGLMLAKEYQPKAIILDLGLPDLDGISVLENLKNDLDTRHIPVHIVSASELSSLPQLKGAVGFLSKPATKENMDQVFAQFDEIIQGGVKKILIVDDDDVSRNNIQKLLSHQGVEIITAATGEDAYNSLVSESFDCIILDLGLPDMSGFDLLAKIDRNKSDAAIPVIVYTGRDLTEEEHKSLQKYAQTVVVKGAESNERLLDEVSLFMHSMTSSLPPEQRNMIQMIHDSDEVLKDKRILLVDDDMRNTFALSGLLQKLGMTVTMASNGQQALDKLDEEEFDMVLMDIMMPIMDGYEATRLIKEQKRFHDLPIIALTAKAMPEDRQICLEAGANDYLAKPIDQERLLSLMRVWLFK
ncbi:MAG: response regulator, partial [Desulfobulbaceae bacterium]|nr:response regulator [Desulfobulbaceae bacterium]